MNNQTQYQLITEMQSAGFNIVACGNCGHIILHKTPADTLICHECGYTSEPCDFPDYIHEELEEKHTLPTVKFTECEETKDKYDLTYQCTKDGVLIEMEGTMQPYYTGRSVEHNLEWGFTNDGYSELVEQQEGQAYLGTISHTIEEEVYTAFYNNFTK